MKLLKEFVKGSTAQVVCALWHCSTIVLEIGASKTYEVLPSTEYLLCSFCKGFPQQWRWTTQELRIYEVSARRFVIMDYPVGIVLICAGLSQRKGFDIRRYLAVERIDDDADSDAPPGATGE